MWWWWWLFGGPESSRIPISMSPSILDRAVFLSSPHLLMREDRPPGRSSVGEVGGFSWALAILDMSSDIFNSMASLTMYARGWNCTEWCVSLSKQEQERRWGSVEWKG
jgi:hypothetical protein